jgi:hypothetical protein
MRSFDARRGSPEACVSTPEQLRLLEAVADGLLALTQDVGFLVAPDQILRHDRANYQRVGWWLYRNTGQPGLSTPHSP